MSEKNEKKVFDLYYISTLDGVRAIAILLVLLFHFNILLGMGLSMPTPFLGWLGIHQISCKWIISTGYEMVDMMLLLSGFCLFLPHAREMIGEGKTESTKQFYKKRVARIFPSYYFCMALTLVIYILPKHLYASFFDFVKDFIPHVFFVHTCTYASYLGSRFNGVLWTLAVEVQFYLLFPFIAKLFKKYMWQTYLVMNVASLSFTHIAIMGRNMDDYGMWINQLPAFLGVYANGMLAAYLFVKMANYFNKNGFDKCFVVFFTMVSIFCIFLYLMYMKDLDAAEQGQLWQVNHRMEIAVLYSIFLIATCFSVKAWQRIFSNRFMKFLSGISFNLYIWHQFIAERLNKYLLFPNVVKMLVWTVVSVIVAWIVTTFIEKPAAGIILGKKAKKE